MNRKIILGAVFFLMVPALLLAGTNPITFQVNMSIQQQSGTFDPVTQGVVVRGSFEDEANPAMEDWKGNYFRLLESGVAGIYTLTISLDDSTIGRTYEFKYVIIDLADTLDNATQGGSWEGVGNRSFTVQAGGNTLDLVYFNDQTVVSKTANVTFKADVSDLVARGWFDPANDTLRVVGGFNDWSQDKAQVMKRELLNPNMLTSTESVTGEPGAKFEFKFRAAPNSKFVDNGWEQGGNHSFTFSGEDMVLDPIKPNIGYAGEPLPQDVTVVFSVDMRNATEVYHNNLLKNIKSVWLKGDKPELGNWGGSWTYDDTTGVMVRMYDDGTNGDATAGDGIWSTQVVFSAGTMSAILYKYTAVADSVDTLNGGTSYLDFEAGFGVNHSAVIPGDAAMHTLPMDRFGSLRALPNPHVFQVDMGIQIAAGAFDPANNIVVMRGSFENESIPNAEDWKGNEFSLLPQQAGALGKMVLKPSAVDPNIYEITVPFYTTDVLGQEYEYKFVIESAANLTDHATQGGTWESIGNRKFMAMEGGDTLDVVFFNDQTSLPKTADVTFKADISDLVAKGWFDPANDTLRVVGGFNDWSQDKAQVMKRELLNPNMLTSTESVTGEPGAKFEFKFRAAPNSKFVDNGWEQGGNHSFIFTGEAMTLDPIKPNIGYAGEPLPQDVTVQFAVYTVGATETYHNLPFNNIKSVWMKGDKPELGSWGGDWTYNDTTGVMVRLYDDGATGGDQVAGDGVWTTQVTFSAGTMSAILYKYGIVADGVDTLNGGVSYLDNEAGFGNNHSMVIPGDSPFYTAPVDTFGSQRVVTAVVNERTEPAVPTSFALYQNHPNPFNPTTSISYDLPKDAVVELAVYNILGQKIRTLVQQKQVAGSYTVIWDGKDDFGRGLATGVYIYRLEAGSFSAVKKMLLMK